MINVEQTLIDNITVDNSLEVLEYLYNKQLVSKPIYEESNKPSEVDEFGNPIYECVCEIESENINQIAYSISKKGAKKFVSYLCLVEMFNLEID